MNDSLNQNNKSNGEDTNNMKTYYLTGLVLPERAEVSFYITEPMPLYVDGILAGVIKYHVIKNHLLIWYKTNVKQDISTIRNNIKTIIENNVNAIGYIKGFAYTVVIDTISEEELKETTVYGIDIPEIAKRNKGKDDITEVKKIMVLMNYPKHGFILQRCLNDVNMAMKHPLDTGFYCFRALECIRKHFGDISEVKDDKKQWKIMKDALGGDKADTDYIKKFANPARHGLPITISDEERINILLKTWDIIDRYIEYLTRNSELEHLESSTGLPKIQDDFKYS